MYRVIPVSLFRVPIAGTHKAENPCKDFDSRSFHHCTARSSLGKLQRNYRKPNKIGANNAANNSNIPNHMYFKVVGNNEYEQ